MKATKALQASDLQGLADILVELIHMKLKDADAPKQIDGVLAADMAGTFGVAWCPIPSEMWSRHGYAREIAVRMVQAQ